MRGNKRHNDGTEPGAQGEVTKSHSADLCAQGLPAQNHFSCAPYVEREEEKESEREKNWRGQNRRVEDVDERVEADTTSSWIQRPCGCSHRAVRILSPDPTTSGVVLGMRQHTGKGRCV